MILPTKKVKKGCFEFGVLIPKTWNDAVRLDATYGNDLWAVAIQSEMDQIASYDTFRDIGLDTPAPAPGYKRITAHLVFDVKHDLRHKACFVAGGHLTDPPKDSVYSAWCRFSPQLTSCRPTR
jgi:hypothetical protein